MKSKNSKVAVIVTIATILVVVLSLVGSSLFSSPAVSPTPTSGPTSTPLPPTETFTPNPCTPENIKPIALDYNRNARAFDDLSVLAQNTPREQLVPIISQLQDIRRKSEDYSGPACLAKLQEYQLAYMNTFINMLVALYSTVNAELTQNDVDAINQGMAASIEYHNQYMAELARLLGVTLIPSNTPMPTGTPPTATPTP
ncbi:MAG: hypothetical protein IT310_11415 [Anaerolineales bacterium]|nr:hypothetical protein [Anaerolineales bacterium]